MKVLSKIILFILLCSVVTAQSISPTAPTSNTSDPNKKVLVLFSYSLTFHPITHKYESISKIFTTHGGITFDAEFLDAKRLKGSDLLIEQTELILHKVEHRDKYDLILVADDYALEIALDNHMTVFKNTPIIYSGVSKKRNLDRAKQVKNCRGYSELIDLESSLNAAHNIVPQAEKIIFIVDDTPIGLNDYEYIMKRKHLFKDLPYLTLSSAELDFDELLDSLHSESENALVFLISLNSLRNKIVVENIQFIQQRVGEASKSPIFTFVNYLAGGVLGGKITDQGHEGVLVANTAIEFLEGKPLDELIIDCKKTSKFVYDFNVMKKFNINKSQLPKGATIINPKKNFIKITFTHIIILISFALVVAIVLLIKQRVLTSKLKLYNKQILESEEKLNMVLENSNDLVFQVDPEFNKIYCSSNYQHGIGNTTPLNCFPDEEREAIIAHLKTLNKKSPSFMHTTEMTQGDKKFYYEWLFSAQFEENGAISSYLGAGRDISEAKKMEIETKALADSLSMTFKATGSAPWEAIIDEENKSFFIVNEMWLSLFGYSPSKFTNADIKYLIDKVVHPEDKKKLIKAFSQCIEGTNPSFTIQWRGLHNKKGYLWMETRARIVHKEEQTKILGITKIINDEKVLQIEYAQQQRKMNKTLEYTNIGTWEYFSDSDEIKCGKNFFKIIGEKVPDNKYQHISILKKFFTEKSYAELTDCFNDVVNHNSKHFDVVLPVSGAQGIKKWINVKGYKRETRHENNKTILQGVFVDVTELETVSQELSQKHNELRSVCSNVGVDIFRINAKTLNAEIIYKSSIHFKGEFSRKQYIEKCVSPDDKSMFIRKTDKILSGEVKSMTMDYRVRPNSSSKEYQWVRAKGYITEYDENQKPAIIYLIQFSVDKQKREHIELLNREQKFSHITENSSDIIVEIDKAQNILYCNNLFCQIVGHSHNELINSSLAQFIHPHDLKDAMGQITAQFGQTNRQTISVLTRLKTEKLGYRCYEWSSIPIEDKNNARRSMIGIGRDITEHKEKERQLQFTINHDRLSGLYSFNYINNYLRNAANETSTMAGVFINIDNLRNINETYGQIIGDDFIVELSDKLYEIIPNDKDIIARISGEQFFILRSWGNGAMDLSLSFIQKLEELNGDVIICGNHQIEVQSSVGYTVYPHDTEHTEDLISLSESAMMTAKESESGLVQRFDQKLYRQRVYKTEIVNEINEADIENAFEMYYQPIVNVNTDSIPKLEALLRWNHPSRGLLQPGSFIKIAEESNQIVEITKVVFKQVLEDLQSWDEKISVSFNLSVKTLQQKNSSDYFIKLIKDAEIEPERICFEITENMALVNNRNVTENLAKFRTNGIQIALDDFGMHYSLLSLLPKVEFDILKIDRFFTQSIADPTSHSIVKMISEIVKEKKKDCIVEGVETEEQLQNVKDFGFNLIQGYYFHKPMNRRDTTKLIQK